MLSYPDILGASVFTKTKDDDKPGMSVEDKTFLKIMDKELSRKLGGTR